MKNYEKYDKEIKEILSQGADVALVKGKIKKCSESDCFSCAFDFEDNEPSCKLGFYNWMFQKYIEPHKLTKQQHAFCEAFPDKWLVRTYYNQLYMFSKKPKRENEGWNSSPSSSLMVISNNFISFPFILKEDTKPYSTSEMLTWGIIGEEEENHSEEAILHMCSNCGMLSTKELEYCPHCKGKMMQAKKRK